MAPEQAKGVEVDQRADIYAFGLILYDMLVGRAARRDRATSAIAELQARMEQAPPPPRSRSLRMCPRRSTRIIDALPRTGSGKTVPDDGAIWPPTLGRLDDNGSPIPLRSGLRRG